jgi:hypothetical protein
MCMVSKWRLLETVQMLKSQKHINTQSLLILVSISTGQLLIKTLFLSMAKSKKFI